MLGADDALDAGDELGFPRPARVRPVLTELGHEQLRFLAGGAAPAGDVAVSPAGDPGHGRLRPASDEDLGAAFLHRPRTHGSHALGGGQAGPDTLHHGELLVKAAAAGVKGGGRGQGVVLSAAHAEAEGEPPTGQRVDGGGLLGEEAGVAQGREQDGGHEPDARGDGRGCGQHHERFRVRVDDTVDDAEAGEGPLVGASRPIQDELAPAGGHAVREPDADVHASSPFGVLQPVRRCPLG